MNILDRLLYRGQHTCPWWLCFIFDNPLRRALQKPEVLLNGLIQPGSTVLDIGCGMGYYSLPMAGMAGPQGRVICIDLQKQMLDAARGRAVRAGLQDRMVFHQCASDGLGLNVRADFALAFWMVHEVRDQAGLLAEVNAALLPGGKLLIAEPRMHVPERDFENTVSLAQGAGFTLELRPEIPMSRAALLRA